MPIELRSWIDPQSYSNSYSTAPAAREAAYFTPVPEPVTADPDYIRSSRPSRCATPPSAERHEGTDPEL
jgi:hypothetical protein